MLTPRAPRVRRQGRSRIGHHRVRQDKLRPASSRPSRTRTRTRSPETNCTPAPTPATPTPTIFDSPFSSHPRVPQWQEVAWYPGKRKRSSKIWASWPSPYCIPAMSSEVERVFSSAKRMVTADRNQLDALTIEANECLRDWYNKGLFDS